MLELKGIRYRYAGYERPALDGVDLALRDGEIVGLAGPNGAGKSTLCLVAAGIAPGSIGGELRGDLVLDGRSIKGLRPFQMASPIGIVFSDPRTQQTRIAATVFEEAAFGPLNLGLRIGETVARVRSALVALGIEDLAERNPGRLSGGETQLVAIASMLAMEPRHLVLDEPLAELDPDGRELVISALTRLAARGTGILIAEHDLELLCRVAGRVVRIDSGRLAGTATPEATPSTGAPVSTPRVDVPIAIRCTCLVHAYPDGTRALDGVDLTIRAGETVAITGPNGSGKTTLVRHFNGLLRPTAGVVEVGGSASAGRRVATLARSVGLTFQDPTDQLFGRTCRDEVSFGASNVGLRGGAVEAAVTEALDAVGLADQATTNPFDLGPSRRRLLAIASVLAMRTPIVVLDEPTMGLDAEERARVGSLVGSLARAGRTVVAISHDARFVAETFGRVIRLEAGRIVHDGPGTAIGSIRGHSRIPGAP